MHYPKVKNFLSAFIAQEKLYKLNDVDNWADWSVQHILINKEKIVADGFISNRDTNLISSSFNNCEPAQTSITDVLPASTNTFQTFAFNDCKQWIANYRTKTADNEIVKSAIENLQQFEKKTHVPVGEKFIDMLSSEITVAISGIGSGSYENNVLAFIKLKEPQKAEAALKTFSILSSEKKNKKIQFEEFQKHKIGLLPVDGLLPALFGNSFSLFQKGFYTIHNNYLIVASKVSTLRTCIDELADDKLLKQNKNFQAWFRLR